MVLADGPSYDITNYDMDAYVQEDGTVVTGSYDVLPILEDFIEEHPDFSYYPIHVQHNQHLRDLLTRLKHVPVPVHMHA